MNGSSSGDGWAMKAGADATGVLCRTRLTPNVPHPYMPPDQFNIDSCARCLDYLRVDFDDTVDDIFDPDPTIPEELNQFCNITKIDQNNCARWQDCCRNAVSCCEDQILTQLANVSSSSLTCPMTWDGFSCIAETPAGASTSVQCPSFLSPNDQLGISAPKICNSSGHWMTRNGSEFTEYKICKDEQQLWDYQIMLLKVICESISIFSLAIGIFLFLYCRKLYLKPRRAAKYKIHTYTFTAMLFYAVSCLIGETIFYYTDPNEPVTAGCETITILIRFFRTFSYSAMSVEAFFLHWNVADTYDQIVRPIRMMIVGVVTPLVMNSIYVIVRVTVGASNVDPCWISPWLPYEWILYSHNVFCLTLNFLLLINLFRVILQMERQTPEFCSAGSKRTSSLRQALRKDFRLMIMFTFIFGVPQVLMIVVPPYQSYMYKVHQIISNSVQMLQGTIAATALCFLSSEVHDSLFYTGLGQLLHRCCPSIVKPPRRRSSVAGQDIALIQRMRASSRRSTVTHETLLNSLH